MAVKTKSLSIRLQPLFVLLQLEMAVACHRKVLSKVVIIGSAQDVPIGSNYHVATSERTKSRKLEKSRPSLLRDREPCAGCHHYAVAVDQSCQQSPSTQVKQLTCVNSAGL